jgi:hypothetical protein
MGTIYAFLRDDLDGHGVPSYIRCCSEAEVGQTSEQQCDGEGEGETGLEKLWLWRTSRRAGYYAFATPHPISRRCWPGGVGKLFA